MLIGCQGCLTQTSKNSKTTSAYVPEASNEQIERYLCLLGSWYGELELEDGSRYHWISKYFDNGEYLLEGEIIGSDSNVHQIEYGDWGIDGNIRFSTTHGFVRNGEKVEKKQEFPLDWHVYELLEVSNDQVVYRHMDTGNLFHVKKVPADYHLNCREWINVTTKEEWFRAHINTLMTYEVGDKGSEIHFSTYSPEESVSGEYAYCASGSGLIRFDENNWVVLITQSFHHEPFFDAVLLMDQDRNFYSINTHPCQYLEVCSPEFLDINCASNLLKTASRDKDAWIKIDPNQILDPTWTTPVLKAMSDSQVGQD